MLHDVRLLVVSRDEGFRAELRVMLPLVQNVKIVAEVAEAAQVALAIRLCSFDVIIVNLDSNPEAGLQIVQEALTVAPDLVMFAASQSTDGQLILKALRLGVRGFLPRPLDPVLLAKVL